MDVRPDERGPVHLPLRPAFPRSGVPVHRQVGAAVCLYRYPRGRAAALRLPAGGPMLVPAAQALRSPGGPFPQRAGLRPLRCGGGGQHVALLVALQPRSTLGERRLLPVDRGGGHSAGEPVLVLRQPPSRRSPGPTPLRSGGSGRTLGQYRRRSGCSVRQCLPRHLRRPRGRRSPAHGSGSLGVFEWVQDPGEPRRGLPARHFPRRRSHRGCCGAGSRRHRPGPELSLPALHRPHHAALRYGGAGDRPPIQLGGGGKHLHPG